MRSRGGWAACVALGAAAVAILAGGAQADAEIYWVEETFAVPDGNGDAGLAFCDQEDDYAISAGLDTTAGGGDDPDDLIYVRAIDNTHPGEGWAGTTANYSGGAATNLSALTVLCDDKLGRGDYKFRDGRDRLVPDGSKGSAGAYCRKHETVIAGGTPNITPLSAEASITSSWPVDLGEDVRRYGRRLGDADHRPDDGWRVAVTNVDDPGDASAWLGYPHAICDRKHDPRDIDYVRQPASADDGELGGAVAKCKQGESLLGGGVRSHSSYEERAFVVETYPWAGAAREGWSAVAHNVDTADDLTARITITAICV